MFHRTLNPTAVPRLEDDVFQWSIMCLEVTQEPDSWPADLVALWERGARWKGYLKLLRHLRLLYPLLFLRLMK